MTRLEVRVCLFLAVQLLRRQQPVRDADGMHRCAGADRLWLRPLRDGDVIPSGCLAVVHRQLPSRRHGLLPTPIKRIFDNGKFPTMPSTLCIRLDLAVCKQVHPNLSILLLTIFGKMHAPMHVDKSTARHALFRRSNGIECLVCIPAVVDQQR